jgi:thiosulfate dehydrogenase [quinone] large subunit
MSQENEKPTQNLALIYGSLLARVWLGVRAVQTGIEKYSGVKLSDQPVNIDGAPNDYGLVAGTAEKVYGFSHYHGVPEALYKKFEAEPLMMGFGLKIYDFILGPALILLGLGVLCGIAYRTSLFLLGLLYISLTWGLILLGQQGSPGVAWLGVHMILIVMALMLAEHNRFSVLKKW